MAIVLQARKTAIFAGTTTSPAAISLTSGWTNGAGGANYTPVADDFVIVGYCIGTAATTDVDVTMTTSGYTEQIELFGNDSAAANFAVYTKKMGGTPDTDVQPGPTTDIAYGGAVTISVWSGVDTTAPLDVALTTATGQNGAVPNPPAITPVTAGAVVVCIAGGAATTGAVFTQSGSELSDFVSANSPDTTDAIIGAGHFAWTSGAFDPVVWTGGVTGSAPSWCAVSLALRPASGATNLAPAASNSATTSASPTLSPKTALTVAATASATTAANVTLTPHGYPFDLPTATVTLSGNYGYTQYKPTTLAANSVVDAAAVWSMNTSKNQDPTAGNTCSVGTDPTNFYPIEIIDAGADIWVYNAFVNGYVPQDSDWSSTYCGSGVSFRFLRCPGEGIAGGGPTVSDVRIDRSWDGIRFIYSNDWTIRRVYASNCRDDFLENDVQEGGTIDDVLVDGCLSFMACDSSSNPPMMPTQQHVNINKAYVRLKLSWQSGVLTHGSPFKYDTDSAEQRANNPTLTLTNCVIAIEDVGHNGKSRLEEAWSKLTATGHSNNVYINLSADDMGSYPLPPANANFTIVNQDGTQQATALSTWASYKSQWLTDHPHLARKTPVKHATSISTADSVTFGTTGGDIALVPAAANSLSVVGTTPNDNWGPNRVVNGDFASSTGWTVPATWAVSGGKATATNAGTGTANKLYDAFRVPLRTQASRIKVEVDVDSISAGSLRRTVGGGTAARTITGLWSEIITITSFNENDPVEWSGDSSTTTFSGVIDNVAVYVDNQINLTAGAGNIQIVGAGAVSVTTAASPTLAPNTALAVASTSSATTSASPVLGDTNLAVQSANSASTSASIILLPSIALAVQAASSATTAADATFQTAWLQLTASTANWSAVIYE